LSPLVNGLRKLHIPRLVAVVLSVAVALGFMGGLAVLVGSQFVDMAADLPKYQSTIEEKIDTLRGATVKRLSDFTTRLRGTLNDTPQSPSAPPANEPQANHPKVQPVPFEVPQPPPDPLSLAQPILRPVLHPLATAAIVFIVTVFILLHSVMTFVTA